MLRIIGTLFFCVTFLGSNAQNSIQENYTRLTEELKKAKHDTTRIDLHLQLASLLNYENNKEAEEHAVKALHLSEKIKYGAGKMKSYFALANNYQFQGKLDLAVENAMLSLRTAEKINNNEGKADACNALGLIYQTKKDYVNSLRYFTDAVTFLKNSENKGKLSRSLNNCGNSFMLTKQYDSALVYMKYALDIRTEMGDSASMADCYNDMANVFYERGESEKALDYYISCYKIKSSIGDREGIAFSAANIAYVYKDKADYDKAEKYFSESIIFSKQINAVELLVFNYEGLADLSFKKGNFKEAYHYHMLFSGLKDSIINVESNKAIADMKIKYDTEKKEKENLVLAKEAAEEKANAEAERAMKEEEEGKKNVLIIAVSSLFILVGLIFYISQKRKQTNVLLKKQNREITEQKLLIEEKNREILDSIEYARRLQEAILPPLKLVKEYLHESFILYKPKDIVAGDFYFLESIAGKIIFAAADCTGHGVPGAMISVVCSNALKRAVKEFQLTDPGEILDKVRILVTDTFEKSENEVKDGMDISLCVLDLKNKTLHWAGANNPLYIVKNGQKEILEINPDKQPIGNFGTHKPFSTHQLNLQSGDILYIFTDGFADQFGGDRGKKYKASRLKDLFLSVLDHPMEEQRIIINKAFEKWRGDLEQVDDVCVVGVRI